MRSGLQHGLDQWESNSLPPITSCDRWLFLPESRSPSPSQPTSHGRPWPFPKPVFFSGERVFPPHHRQVLALNSILFIELHDLCPLTEMGSSQLSHAV